MERLIFRGKPILPNQSIQFGSKNGNKIDDAKHQNGK